MKKSSKLTILIFTFVTAFLICFNVYYKPQIKPQASVPVRAKTVHPSANAQAAVHEEVLETDENETETVTSLIALNPGEKLLNAISIDVNSDTFDDQVVSLLKSGSPYICLVTGIYNPSQGVYQRASEIETNISQQNTFSFSVLDVTGDHVNSLTFSGINNKGESVLKVFKAAGTKHKFEYDLIADLTADGSIFIQQLQRSDPYSFSQTKGESYPIRVYSSDTSRSKNSLDQIQTLYNWDSNAGRYVKVSESRVTGKKTAAGELAKIQNSTGFEDYLAGLWFKSSSSDANLRYIFFDPAKRELIFSTTDTQEPYSWNTTSTRRNGVHITSMNKSINNLMRRIDIVLNDVDEIKVRVNDEVKMAIGEDTLWDGTYKKISTKTALATTVQQSDILQKLSAPAKEWSCVFYNETVNIAIKNGKFEAKCESWESDGALSTNIIAGTTLLECRTFDNADFINGYYQFNMEESEIDGITRQTLTLAPVSVSTKSFVPKNKPGFKLERELRDEN